MEIFGKRADMTGGRSPKLPSTGKSRIRKTGLVVLLPLLVLISCAPVERKPPEPSVSEPAMTEEGLFQRAEQLNSSGEATAALSAYTEFYTRFPDSPSAPAAIMKAAAINETQKAYTQARERFRNLLDRYPESYFVNDATIGILKSYFNEGRFEELAAFRSTIEDADFFGSQKIAVCSLSGEAYLALGRHAEAAEQFALAYLAAPASSPEGEKMLARLQSTLGMLSPLELQSLVEEISDPRLQAMLKETAAPLIFERLHIGCILPLTGRFETFGHRALQGIELAVAQFGARFGTDSLKVIIKDSASDPEKAASAIRELVSEQHVAAIIGAITTAETAALEAQKAGVPIITLSQKEGITDIGDYVFRNFITHTLQVQALVSYTTNRLGIRRFAMLYPDENYGRIFMNAFWDEVIAQNGIVVAAEAYNPADTDFADPIKRLVGLFYPEPSDLRRARLAAFSRLNMRDPDPYQPGASLAERLNSMHGLQYLVKDALAASAAQAPSEKDPENPEPIVDFGALFIPDAPQKSGLILPQLAYYDIKNTYVLGTNLWHSSTFIDMTKQYNRGVIFPEGFFADSADATVKAFVEQFQSVFDSTPGFIEAVAYDTAMMLFNTSKGPEIISRDALRDALTNMTPFSGTTGITSFSENGDCIKDLRLLRIRGGKFVEVTVDGQ